MRPSVRALARLNLDITSPSSCCSAIAKLSTDPCVHNGGHAADHVLPTRRATLAARDHLEIAELVQRSPERVPVLALARIQLYRSGHAHGHVSATWSRLSRVVTESLLPTVSPTSERRPRPRRGGPGCTIQHLSTGHGEIKSRSPHSQFSLYQQCGLLVLISKRVRKTAARARSVPSVA